MNALTRMAVRNGKSIREKVMWSVQKSVTDRNQQVLPPSLEKSQQKMKTRLDGSIMDERIVHISRYVLLEVTSSSLLTLSLEPQETGHFKFVELQDAQDRILSRLDATEETSGARSREPS
ncbi:hypothetical protein Tco_1450294 [Tanacetum coccineum]